MSRSLTILGSTGSVGRATLDVIKSNPGLFTVHALTAQSNVSLLIEQAKENQAQLAVIGDESLLPSLRDGLKGTGIEVAAGRQAIIETAGHPVDCTMAAIVGMAGLEPLMAAIRNGKSVAIANKEPLVAAGKIVMDAAREAGTTLLPVDSEHNAIFQVFEERNRSRIVRIILTASGGPFREWPIGKIHAATPAQAIAHPNWSMGQKISVDSATMMNKALEVIEAHHLFALPVDKIDVLVHPQSIIHSMVEYEDGSVLAQMGAPDMRIPISHALGWPERISGSAQRLDFTKLSALTFDPVDDCRFPAIKLAYDCLQAGQAACVAMNAANEEAVAAFLSEKIGFRDIFDIVYKCVKECENRDLPDLASILEFDQNIRLMARRAIMELNPSERKTS